MIKVLKAYYCQGLDEKTIELFYGVRQSNLNRDRLRLEELAGKVEELFELKSVK